MVLAHIFSPKSICLNLGSTDKDELFEEMVQTLVTVQPGINREKALAALHERESKMSTGIMHDIAVPHGNCESVRGVVGAIGISRAGIAYDALDKQPVHLVFMMLCNPSETERHLEVLRDLASILQNPSFVKAVMEQRSEQDVYNLLCEYEASIAG